jgi:hypothetical protein
MPAVGGRRREFGGRRPKPFATADFKIGSATSDPQLLTRNGTSVFGKLQSYPYEFAAIKDRDKIDLVKKFIGAEIARCLRPETTAVNIMPGRRCGMHPT